MPVTEGFSQGCPFSPIFAAIVLNEILPELQDLLNNLASQQLELGIKGDDNKGTLSFILVYVDDCNAMVALQDVEPLLDKFKELAEPLGAIMNTEKTRILTSTNHRSTIENLFGQSMKHAVLKYSRTKDTSSSSTPYEVTFVYLEHLSAPPISATPS